MKKTLTERLCNATLRDMAIVKRDVARLFQGLNDKGVAAKKALGKAGVGYEAN